MSSQLSADPQKLLEVLRRHRRKAIAIPIACFVIGVAILFWFPRTYQSEARLYLRVGRESVGLDPTVNTGQGLTLPRSDQRDEVKTAIEVLKSPAIAAAVVERLGVDTVLGRDDASQQGGGIFSIVKLPFRAVAAIVHGLDPISDRELAVNAVRKNLGAEAEFQSTVIIVRYNAETPQLAQKLCDEVINVYRDEHMRIHRAEESSPFFKEQQERLSNQLNDALEALRVAKNERGFSDIDQRQATLESEFKGVETDRLRTEQELAASQAKIQNLEQQLASMPERVISSKRSIPNQAADMMRMQFYNLQLKSMELQARYNDTHPLVKATNAQVADAKEVLGQQSADRVETTDDLNAVRTQLTLELKQAQSAVAGYQSRQTELNKQREAVLAELRELNEAHLQLDRLTQRVQLSRDSFLQYARNLEEARIDKELENDKISNLSILQPAMLSERPVTPSNRQVAAATFILATAGTVVIVLLSERLQTPVPSADISQRRRTPRQRIKRRLVPETNGKT
jgi:uncharacterized protein involved in exopolysaccharide biosynthesis